MTRLRPVISAKVRSTARRSTPWKSRLIGWPVKRRGVMSPALRSATVGSVRAVRVTAAAGVRTVAVAPARRRGQRLRQREVGRRRAERRRVTDGDDDVAPVDGVRLHAVGVLLRHLEDDAGRARRAVGGDADAIDEALLDVGQRRRGRADARERQHQARRPVLGLFDLGGRQLAVAAQRQGHALGRAPDRHAGQAVGHGTGPGGRGRFDRSGQRATASTAVCSPDGPASTTVTSRPSGDAFTL